MEISRTANANTADKMTTNRGRLSFALPLQAVAASPGGGRDTWTFCLVNNVLRVCGRDRWWSMQELVTRDTFLRRAHANSRVCRGVSIQLHPVSSNPSDRPQSLIPLSILKRCGLRVLQKASDSLTPVLSVDRQRLTARTSPKFVDRLARSPIDRLKKNWPIVLPNFEGPRRPPVQLPPLQLDMEEANAVPAQAPPSKRKRRSRRRKCETYECAVCEEESAAVFSMSSLFDGFLPDPTDILSLCSDGSHHICAKCVVETFKSTKRIPCCMQCRSSGEPDTNLPFAQAFCLFAGVLGSDFEEQCTQKIPLCEVPDICTQEFVDDYVEEGSLMDQLCERYLMHRASTEVQCACHPDRPARGRINTETNLVEFDGDPRKYIQEVVLILDDGTAVETSVLEQHAPVCAQCLTVHAPGCHPWCQCEINKDFMNSFFRATEREQCKRRLFRNKEISIPQIMSFFSETIFAEHLSVVCPGCHTTIHRTEACNEIACPCGYKICYHCGFARYQSFPLLDHFSTDTDLVATGQRCPRYCENLGPLAGEPCPCTSACQSHKGGDCNVPSHQLYQRRLTLLRKQTRIKRFLQCLDPSKRVSAMWMLKQVFGSFCDQPLDTVQPHETQGLQGSQEQHAVRSAAI